MHLPTSLAITLSLLTKRQAFETYDSCAESCFVENLEFFASQCTEQVGSQGYIACVCGNTDFDVSSASCIFTQCGPTILNQTASQHDYNCNLNGSPPALDAQQFIAAGHSDSGDGSDSTFKFFQHMVSMRRRMNWLTDITRFLYFHFKFIPSKCVCRYRQRTCSDAACIAHAKLTFH